MCNIEYPALLRMFLGGIDRAVKKLLCVKTSAVGKDRRILVSNTSISN